MLPWQFLWLPAVPQVVVLTFLPVMALHVDAEDGDLLPLQLVVVAVDVGDVDAPGRQVPQRSRPTGRLGGRIVLHHHGGLLHLQDTELVFMPGDR